MGFDFDQNMTVGTVKYHGSTISNNHVSNTVTFSVPTISTAGTLDSVTITFSGTPVAPVTSVPSGYNYSSTYHCIYTLGEAFRGSTWWPCRDSLVDKIDSVDIIVTTPSAYRAGSNGVVTEQVVGPNRICTWKSRHPIATYLINFAAANYTNYQFNATSLTHTVPVYNYLYTGTDYNATYQGYLNVLQNVMPAYATLLNTDYPFYDEKYGTAESGTGWGALEVQSMTFIDRTSYAGGGSTLAHELAHQWFGDKLTTNDWHQIWLNEGFAQFFESVIYPELLSPGSAATSRQNLKNNVTSTSTTYVTNISNADNIFIGSTTQPYPKGAMLLSMLRAWLGDTQFYTALHDYQNAPGLVYNFTSVDSLQKYMQTQTPNDLTQFFSDWIYQKGRVTYTVKYQYVTKGVYIQLTQSQTSAGAGYFDTPVPIEIKNSSGLDTVIVVIDRNGTLYNSVTGTTYNSSTIYFPLSATPSGTPIFDPNNASLSTGTFTSSSTLSSNILLPIQDINLVVTGKNHDAKLNWKIGADEPLTSIEVQKSFDGVNFEVVAKTPATKVSATDYAGTYDDYQAGDASVYYRLKVNKLSGSYTYSAIKVVNFSASVELTLAPNPVQNSLTITIPITFLNQSQQISLRIYNGAGSLVQEKRISAGSRLVYVSCKSFPAGLYKAMLLNEKQQQLQSQFIKQ